MEFGDHSTTTSEEHSWRSMREESSHKRRGLLVFDRESSSQEEVERECVHAEHTREEERDRGTKSSQEF